MAEFTKGELKQGKSNTLLYINGVNFGDVLVGGLPHEECEANARELVRRWNSQPDLYEACKRMLGAMRCDELNCGRVFDDDLRKEVKEKAEAALAKADGKEK